MVKIDKEMMFDLSSNNAPEHVPDDCHIMRLYNKDRKKILKGEVNKFISRLSNLDQITTLIITGNMSLGDCGFIEKFNKVERLYLDTSGIDSLSGLESASNLIALSLFMKKNHKVKLESIITLSLNTICIEHATVNDLKELSRCKPLKFMKLYNCGEINTKMLCGGSIIKLEIVNATNTIMGGFDCIDELKELSLASCSKLDKIIKGNDNIENLSIEKCNMLDMKWLKEFPGLKEIELLKCKSKLDLNILNCMENIGFANINMCNIDTATEVRLDKVKKLKRVWLVGMNSDILRKISLDNPDIAFTNLRIFVMGGKDVDKYDVL